MDPHALSATRSPLSTARAAHALACLALAALLPVSGACTPDAPVDPVDPVDPIDPIDTPVGRWSGQTTIDDLDFAPGRPIPFEELFTVRADGSMRGDFVGHDDVTGCSVDYQLRGTWSEGEDAGTLAVEWTSVVVTSLGCDDEALDDGPTDVTEGEAEVWDDELEGEWSVAGDTLTIVHPAGELAYERVGSALPGRWAGRTTIDDLDFTEGDAVVLDELFYFGPESVLLGRFEGHDDVSGCSVDDRLRGEWTVSASQSTLDVSWTSILVRIDGCDDGALDLPRTEVVAEEGELWDDELAGEWSIDGDRLVISNAAGGTIEYQSVR
jgi:hypothetical protein